MLKRPSEQDSNARATKVTRRDDDTEHTELDRKISVSSSSSRLDAKRPTAAANETDSKVDENPSVNETFPEKLADTLRSHNVKDSLWWNDAGRSFAMTPKNLTKTMLEKLFQGTQLASFQRKMKRWGFKRCFDTSFPRGALVYRHPLFQRDRPELMSQMSAGKKKCEVAKPAVSNQASDNREHQPTAQRGLLASGPLLVNPSRLPYYDRISAASERHDTRQLQNNHHRQQQHQNQQRAAAEQYRVATTIHNRMQSNATVRELCFQTLHDRQQQRDWHNSFIRTVPFSGATGQQQQGDISAAAGSAQRVLTLLRLRQLLSRSRTRGQQE